MVLPEDSTQSRTWETFIHLGGLLAFTPIPFGNLIGPLILWLLKRDESPSVDAHGKAALNFQLTLIAILLVSTVATIVLMLVLVGFLMLPFLILLWIALPLVNLVCSVIAAIKASNGRMFDYPISIRFID